MVETLTVDNLTFEVRKSETRRTVGITVGRAGELILHAPQECSEQIMQEIAHSRLFWVYQKLEEKQLMLPERPQRRYTFGETFYYLGRSYRLRLVDDEDSHANLRLYGGWFNLKNSLRAHAEDEFAKWFKQTGQRWIERRVFVYAERMNLTPQSVKVRELGYRWGSCTKLADINFHWQTMTLPIHAVDYIIVHELSHIKIKQHTDEFWRQVARIVPDYRTRKRWIADNGADYIL